MRTKIQKWGNSLGVRIPRPLAVEAGVSAGSEVDLSVDAGRLVVEPLRRTRPRLADLLRRVRRDNLHGEIDMGGPAGREVW